MRTTQGMGRRCRRMGVAGVTAAIIGLGMAGCSSAAIPGTAPSGQSGGYEGAQSDETPSDAAETFEDDVAEVTSAPEILGMDGMPTEALSRWARDEEVATDEYPQKWHLGENTMLLEHDGLCYPTKAGASALAATTVTFFDSDAWATEQALAFFVGFMRGNISQTDSGFTEAASYDETPLPVSKAGDRLILTENKGTVAIVPVDARHIYAADKPAGEPMYSGELTAYEEVAGVTVPRAGEGVNAGAFVDEAGFAAQVVPALEAAGVFANEEENGPIPSTIHYYANEKTSIPVGRYAGTKWEESRIWFDTPVAIKPQGVAIQNREPTRTHDGYFFVDLSDLQPGDYLIFNGSYKGREDGTLIHVE